MSDADQQSTILDRTTSSSGEQIYSPNPYSDAVDETLKENQDSLHLPLDPTYGPPPGEGSATAGTMTLPLATPDAAEPSAGPYAHAVQEVVDEDDLDRRLSIYDALTSPPDRAAEAARIGKELGGIPPRIVEENFSLYQHKAEYNNVLEKVLMSPVLSRLGLDSDYLRRSAGDIDTVAGLDLSLGASALQQGLKRPEESSGDEVGGYLQRFGDGFIGSVRALAAAPWSANAALWNLARSPADLIGADDVSTWLDERAEKTDRTAADIRGDQPQATPLQRAIYNGLESSGVALLTLPASVMIGNAAPTLAVMSAMTAGQSYDEARSKGLSPLDATLFAGGQAMVDYLAGKIPLVKLLRGVKAGSPFFKTVVQQLVIANGSDQIARHWQDFNEWVVLHPESTFGDYLKARPNAAWETFVANATATFMQTTGAYTIGGAVAKAQAGAKSIGDWFDLARKSKQRESDPTQFAADTQRLASEHGIDEVHIAAPDLIQALQEAGDKGPAMLEQMPSVGPQLLKALATDGDVHIPTGELIAAASGSGAESALTQHLRIDPEAPSLAQSKKDQGRNIERSSVAEDTTDTLSYEESSPRAFGIPDAAGVPIFSFRDAEGFKAHPDYSAGKKGDINAAIRFVSDMVEPAQIREANDRFGPNVIYVPLHAEETNGRNKIPIALASLYAEATGATVDMSITQTNVAGHTGARPLERLIARPLFSGEVEPGRRYVLVDDVSVLGGSLAELVNHIRSGGGDVAGLVVLANAGRSGLSKASKAQISKIERRFGDEIKRHFGIEPRALTADEAAYILNYKDVDALRTSVAKARDDRGRRSGP